MKILILLRHGQAQPYAPTDAQRPLTAAGQEKVAASAQALKEAGYRPTLLCSPLLRAVQSAQIAGAILQVSPQPKTELDGHLSAAQLLVWAREQLRQTDCLMLVGHNPNISSVARILNPQYISFSAGEYAVFDVTDAARPAWLQGEH